MRTSICGLASTGRSGDPVGGLKRALNFQPYGASKLHLVSSFGKRLTQTPPTSIFVGPTMHFLRFWAPHGLPTSPGRRQTANPRSHPAPPNPQKRLRGAHILTLRRSWGSCCKHFRQTTYTNTSNIDFCRTYDAFDKVLGPPRAPHFSRSMLPRRQIAHARSHSALPNLQKRFRGVHILSFRRSWGSCCQHFR